MNNPNRRYLYDAYKSIIDLRLNNPAIFNNTTFTYDFFNGGGLVKLFQIEDPNTAGKKVTVIANLDVVQQTRAVTFQGTGNWINYISNGTGAGLNGATASIINLTTAAQSITLAPGEYHIYVSVPPCATVAPTVTYCQNITASPFTATGTNLLWYTTATGGSGSATAPIPITTTVGAITYFVSQTTNACEGPRATIVVNTNSTPAAPVVNAAVNYCQNITATPLSATGTNLLWYTNATGGTGSSTAPTPSTLSVGSINYYVSQTTGTCEGPRAVIAVTVNALATAPTVTSPVVYCQNVTATALKASGTNLLWYANATGGVGSSTAPTPSTVFAANTNYYVTQSNSCGEGARALITVNITAIPPAPTNLTSTNVTLNSATLNWSGTANSFYTVEYKLTSATVWNIAATALQVTTFNLTGLSIGSNYQWRVGANCAVTGTGNVSAA